MKTDKESPYTRYRLVNGSYYISRVDPDSFGGWSAWEPVDKSYALNRLIEESEEPSRVGDEAEVPLKLDEGKIRYDLIPPRALRETAKAFMSGLKDEREPNDWLKVSKGEHWRYRDALQRHLEAVKMGEELDKDSNLHHYAHMAANALILLELVLREEEGDE